MGWLHSLGLYTQTDPTGRLYPYSNQAADVSDLLLHTAARLHIDIQCGCTVTEIIPKKQGALIKYSQAVGSEDEPPEEFLLRAGAVILAMGGFAAPKFGTDGSGLRFAARLGVPCAPAYPCLVPLKCRKEAVRGLSGVRVKGDVSLFCGAECLRKESGEIQFTDYGLSGIAVMQLSCRIGPGTKPEKLRIELDLFPSLDTAALTQLFADRMKSADTVHDIFLGLLNRKLAAPLLRAAGLPDAETPVERLPKNAAALLAEAAKHRSFDLLSPCGWDQAQTTGGGVLLSQLNASSFEWKGAHGLYFVGEMADAAGDCGGYNLYWAFASGLAAGRHAAQSSTARPGASPKRKKEKH